MIVQLIIRIRSDPSASRDDISNTLKEITVLGDPEGIRELHHILEGITSREKIEQLTIKNLDGIQIPRKEFFQHPHAEATSLSYDC
jgi:hypothetical protein